MLVQSTEDLDAVLVGLRSAKGDHQWIEAKRARSGMPVDLWKSLSALSNSGGGLVLLGVDEQRGAFDVTGIESPAQTAADLQALCSRAEPPLRPAISLISHGSEHVLVAHVPSTARGSQPCHFPEHGPAEFTSFVRVGDSDEQLSAGEVADMLAARSQRDDSRRPAPEQAHLSKRTLSEVFGRPSKAREAALRRLAVYADDGTPTLGAWLALGESPEEVSPLARVACLTVPRPGDPIGAQQRGTHIEGTIGELLDGVMAWLRQQLGVVQVSDAAGMRDALDFPEPALREAISNALIHRSFSPVAESTTIAVRVTASTVEITNPGGVHPGVDPRLLGLSPLSTPRNYALVRLCGQLSSPSGRRLVEAQASGIARADLACRAAGTAPLIFGIGPARFTALALRGRLDLEATRARRPAIGEGPDRSRIVAFLERIATAQNEDATSVFFNTPLDSVTAARLLAPSLIEHVVPILNDLVAARVLREVPRYERVAWALTELHATSDGAEPSVTNGEARKSRRDAVKLLLTALAQHDTPMQPRDLDLGLTDRGTRDVIQRALKAGLVEATSDVLHDPTRAYRLTADGRRQVGK